MFHVRTTKTASGATAVQIVSYKNRKTVIVSHIGSADSKDDLILLKQEARQWIEQTTGQTSLFTRQNRKQTTILLLGKIQYLGVRHTFIYDVLNEMLSQIGFKLLIGKLITDLVLIRMIQPASKLESLDLLSELFGIVHQRRTFYRTIPQLVSHKDTIENKAVQFARTNFSFDFSIVFYDVTTLYFETFKEDDEENSFRKAGFSKDNKPNQPQILIGLIVTKEGFPVSYEIFKGNTFEGKTMLSIILQFQKKHKVKTLTVVADAAMIDTKNIDQLKENNLSYIVGARLANTSPDLIKRIGEDLLGTNPSIEERIKLDGVSIRIETEKYGTLVCDFSFKRYQKDKREMEKQIEKAKRMISDPATIVKRGKFIKSREKMSYELNTALMDKTALLLGIKGYYTNLADVDNQIIITHYHSLWHVEKAFRIAKNDLQMRPIYHFKKQAIEAHVLICFMALATAKYMELKTGKSIKRIVKLLKSITEANILNKVNGEIIVMRQELTDEVKKIIQDLSH